MEKQKLGYSELELTPIGLGTFAMGGDNWKASWGPQDDEVSIKTIHRTLELGINWIDTAAVYGFGKSEQVVGRALGNIAPKPIVATKCGRISDGQGGIVGKLDKESIRNEIEASLKHLEIEVIDLYQVHWPTPEEYLEEAWATISELVKEGKVRYAGASNFSVDQLQRVQSIHPVASLQTPYSMLRRGFEKELQAYCLKNNIGVVVYSPMQKGILTGKITHNRMKSLPEGDHRNNDPDFSDPRLSIHLELINGLRPIAEKNGLSLAQLTIAWTLHNPAVTSAIVGARQPGQIEETVKAGGAHLSNGDWQEIDGLLDRHTEAINQLQI